VPTCLSCSLAILDGLFEQILTQKPRGCVDSKLISQPVYGSYYAVTMFGILCGPQTKFGGRMSVRTNVKLGLSPSTNSGTANRKLTACCKVIAFADQRLTLHMTRACVTDHSCNYEILNICFHLMYQVNGIFTKDVNMTCFFETSPCRFLEVY
jgi:hypothetical protein